MRSKVNTCSINYQPNIVSDPHLRDTWLRSESARVSLREIGAHFPRLQSLLVCRVELVARARVGDLQELAARTRKIRGCARKVRALSLREIGAHFPRLQSLLDYRVKLVARARVGHLQELAARTREIRGCARKVRAFRSAKSARTFLACNRCSSLPGRVSGAR